MAYIFPYICLYDCFREELLMVLLARSKVCLLPGRGLLITPIHYGMRTLPSWRSKGRQIRHAGKGDMLSAEHVLVFQMA